MQLPGFLKSLVNRWRNPPDIVDSSKNKTYIYHEESDYYDHVKPKLMTGQEIDNMPMSIEDREQPQNNNIIIDPNSGKQSQVGSEHMKQLQNRGRDVIIPGQVVRDANGNVAKKVPLRTDIPVPPAHGQQHAQHPHGQHPGMHNNQGPMGYPTHPQPQYQQPMHSQAAPSLADDDAVFHLFTVEDAYYLYIELPGMDKTSLDVGVSDRNVSVSCDYIDFSKSVNEQEVIKKESKKKKNFVVAQKSNVTKGKFAHTYTLQNSINDAGVGAKFDNGVLELYLPFGAVEQKKVNVTML